MKIVIIEDEKLTAGDLAEAITQSHPQARIEAILYSVRESLQYFSGPVNTDLIFSDIQLGDGLSFEIFSKTGIRIPTVFCTAFDEYALNAFKANGIDYILKPFSIEAVRDAIDKFVSLKGNPVDYAALEKLFAVRKTTEAGSVLVYYQEQIFPVGLQQIAFFYLKNGAVSMTTFDNKTFLVNKSLDELGKIAEPLFFRTNRQFLVNRKAVVKASNHLARRLSVHLSMATPESVTVSREKLSAFLEWLTQG